MYSSLRHDANIKESMLNGSSSNLPDSASTGRPFTTSFSGQSGSTPVYHHYGLHNYNMPGMQAALSSRNSAVGGVPSSGVHQPSGNVSSGRFTSNNVPLALSQLSHGSLHGHSGVPNRAGISVVGNHGFSSSMNGVGGSLPGGSASGNRGGVSGIGVSPLMGNATPRISSAVGSIAGGGGAGSSIGRTVSSGGGLAVPGLTSRVNLTANNGSGSINVQAHGRPMSSVLQHPSQQMMSFLGSSYSSSAGGIPVQAQTLNSQLSSMGLSNDGSSSENAPFDINDFPQLSARQNPTGGPQGQIASLRKQGVGVSSLVQQSQEFSIQNEDFPALSAYKGGNGEYPMDLHSKEHQHHDSAIAMMQSQHYPMSRSSGFPLGSSFVSHRQSQQQKQSASSPAASNSGANFAAGNSADFVHLQSSDLFPSSHGISASYHSQVPGLRSNGPNNSPGLGSYDQLIQQYQNQSQYLLQQVSAVGQPSREQGIKTGPTAADDRFGLLGLLSVIRMTDIDLTTLALGIDLTTLGLNLNSKENLYKSFGSPWSDAPPKGEPEYTLPKCYLQLDPPRLQEGHFSRFERDTLFYIFYSMPNDEAQVYAANELYNQGWLYHRDIRLWFTRVPNTEPLVKTKTYERGSYLFFDPNTWETFQKENFVLPYDMIEIRPTLPQH